MKASKIAFALCFGSMMVVATGCGKSKALVAAEEYEKAACACKDVACTTEAAKKYGEHAKEAGAASGGDAEAMAKATGAAVECTTKITMASIPAMPGMPKK
jgi:hypothetical protein